MDIMVIDFISWNWLKCDLNFLFPGYSGSIGGVPLGVPMSNHEYDMTDADSFNSKGFYSVGANPPPAWSQRELWSRSCFPFRRQRWANSYIPDVGPVHKAPPAVATQLVVPTQLSDGPVSVELFTKFSKIRIFVWTNVMVVSLFQVDLTCHSCQHHVRTNTKSGPSTLAWALCCCLCVIGMWVDILLISDFYLILIVHFIQMHPLCPCPLLHDSVQGNRALLLKLWHSAREVQRLEGEGGLLRSSLFSHITCSWSWLYNTALTLITSTRLRKWFVNTPSWYQVLIYICWKSIFFIFI